MPYARVNDLEMNYEESGTGFPLVLIHGLGGNLDGWDARFLEMLERRYRVIAPDNRGSGKSRPPDDGREFSIGQLALDVLGLLNTLNFKSAYVLGHSMGGMVAQELALSYPDAVAKLVLCSTNCGGLECITPDHGTEDSVSGEATLEEQACHYVSTLFPDSWLEEHKEYVREMTLKYLEEVESNRFVPRQFMASVKFDSCGRLGSMSCPTLVVCGVEDEVIPPGNSKILAERIPGARLVEYQGAGHALFTQIPHKFARDVIDFLG